MRYGLFGAHRSGKSTLAAAAAKVLGIEYLPIKTTEVAKRFGFNPVLPMTLSQRIDLQAILLDDFIKTVHQATGPFITDRTPLDHAAYLLTEINMRSGDQLDAAALQRCKDIYDAAIEVTSTTFEMVYYLQPLSTYEVDPTKPPENRIYQLHYEMVSLGILMQHSRRFNWASIPAMDLEERTSVFCQSVASRIQSIQESRQSATHLH